MWGCLLLLLIAFFALIEGVGYVFSLRAVQIAGGLIAILVGGVLVWTVVAGVSEDGRRKIGWLRRRGRFWEIIVLFISGLVGLIFPLLIVAVGVCLVLHNIGIGF